MAEAVRDRGEESQDLAGIVSRYRRHLPIVLALTVLGVVLAGIGTLFLPKKYTATAELTYSPQVNTDAVKGTKDPALSDQARDAQIDAQVQLVGSLPVARMVVQTLHLERDADIAKGAEQYKVGAASAADALAASTLVNLRVRRVGQTPLFDLNYTHKDPLQAAEISNAFASAYLKLQVAQKIAQSKDNAGQINQQLESLRSAVVQADAAVARFRAEHNLLSPPDSPMGDQEMSSVNQQLAEARAAQAESDARLAAASLPGGAPEGVVVDSTNPTNTLGSPAMAELRRQKAEVSRKVAELSAHYGPRYPNLLDAQSELGAINQQIQQEQDRVMSTVRAQASVSEQRTASLESSQAATQRRLAGNVAAGVQLADLQGRATTARQLYEAMLTSSGQASVTQDLVQPDAMLSTPASPPLKPSSPSLPINILLGGVLGAAIGIGIAFLRERWTVGLNTIDDVDRLLDQNYLNTIPTMASSIDHAKTQDPIEAVLLHPLSLLSESYRSLATSLLYADRSKQTKVIGITSALPKEGKSTTSASVARVLAMSGSKVLLMDVDLRRRSVTDALAPTAAVGLIEVLAGAATLDEALVADTSGAMILPLAPRAHLGAQPFDTPEFDKLMTKLRASFDVIVMDTAPVLAVVDTRLLVRHIDALALLARWRGTPVKAIRAAIHQIESVGGAITGVAMTFVNIKTQQQSGYGDASYYYREMKDYYVAAE
jgi:succinoglycan biosynthesis transport protein ExoP